MNSASRFALFFGILLAIRVAVALSIDSAFDVVKDVDLYGYAARSILAGEGFSALGEPILWRAPIYSYFLAGLFKVFGDSNYLAVLFAHSALDALTGLLVWWLGQRLFGRTVGVVAAVLFVLHPFSAYYSFRLMPEPLFTLAFTATAAALLLACDRPLRPMRFAFVGLLAAVTALIKPVMVAFTPFIAVLLLVWHYRRPLAALPSAVAMVAAFVIVITPWAIRNYTLTERIVPIATAGGYTFWMGNNQATDGRESDELTDDPVQLARYSEDVFAVLESIYGEGADINSEIVNGQRLWRPVNISPTDDDAFMRAGLQGVFENPGGAIVLVAKKAIRFWHSIHVAGNKWAQTYISIIQACFLLVVIAGIVGALRAGLGLAIAPVIAAVLYLNLMYAATYATLRYSIPLVPILLIFATYAVVGLTSRLAERAGLELPALQPAGQPGGELGKQPRSDSVS